MTTAEEADLAQITEDLLTIVTVAMPANARASEEPGPGLFLRHPQR